MEESIKERTIKFVKYKRIMMKEFEQKCGLSTGYVTAMRKGFGTEKLNNVLTAYPELNREWLLYGEGTMLKQSLPSKEVDNSDKVPLIPILAQGGALTDYVGSVRASDCEMVTSPVKGADYAITIHGDSMSPDYPSGSHVLIKRINERAFVEWGKVYVLDTCNGVVIKRLMPTTDTSIYRCESINDKYPPFEVATDNIYGVYRVLMVMVLK